ncbi:hypothetical protein H1R20_g15294, partial [Candolleomyces eurysporus]
MQATIPSSDPDALDLSPTATLTDLQPVQNQYLQPSLPLKVEEIFQDTRGRDLWDVLKDAKLGKGALQSDIDQGTVKCDLAPCFGPLMDQSPSVKTMDDATIVMLWASLKELTHARSIRKDLNFKTVEAIFRKNPFLEHVPTKDVNMSDTLTENRDFKFWDGYLGNKEANRLNIDKLVRNWFNNLIKDVDVRERVDIALDEVRDIVARTSSDLDSQRTKDWKKTFLDFGILRFPDITYPYIRIYHIRLSAWALCRDFCGVYEKNCNGVEGEYCSREYRPREPVIQGLSREVLKQAVGEAQRFIDDLCRVEAPSTIN